MGYDIEWRRTLPSNLRRPDYGARPLIIDLEAPESIPALLAFKAYHPEAAVIAIANGNFKMTEEALRAGVSRMVFVKGAGKEKEKGKNLEMLKEAVRGVCEEISSREELEALKALAMPRIMAKSPKMKDLVRLADEASPIHRPLVLCGQPGSGRELIARYIHVRGRGAAMPFVTLVDEARLAAATHAARGGTLFIKEIFVLGKDALAEVKRMAGGGPDIKASARVVFGCFSPGDVLELDGLDYMAFEVPSLADRSEDIVPLANLFIEELTAFLKTDGKYLTKSAREALLERDYPGGAAELKKLVQKAYFLSPRRGIRAGDLPGERSGCSFKSFLDDRLKPYLGRMGELPRSTIYETVIGEVEKALIELAMSEMKGNKLRASRALGMNRNTFRAKLKSLKIK